MGQLVEGVWKDEWYDTGSSGGEFVRDTSRHRNWVTADGSPGPTGEGGFKADLFEGEGVLTRPDGSTFAFDTLCRIDTANEVEYYMNGGILHYVLRKLAA